MNPFRLSLAVFCGALIGALVARNVIPGYYWAWNVLGGGMSGGVIAWMVCDFSGFRAAFSKAFQKAWIQLLPPRQRQPRVAPRSFHSFPTYLREHVVWNHTLAALCVSSGAATLVAVTLSALLYSFPEVHKSFAQSPYTTVLSELRFVILPSYFLTALFAFPLASFIYTIKVLTMSRKTLVELQRDEEPGDVEAKTQMMKRGCLYWNPFCAPFSVVWFTFLFLKFVVVHLYRFTASNERIAAFLLGSIFAVAGYGFGRPVLSACAGALCGFSIARIERWRLSRI
ncbi:MAG: hypothetical protein JWN64_54 [Parcubacteria group bacterium]|nr:hypothetical protein [Parcubacteria group bacterium]